MRALDPLLLWSESVNPSPRTPHAAQHPGEPGTGLWLDPSSHFLSSVGETDVEPGGQKYDPSRPPHLLVCLSASLLVKWGSKRAHYCVRGKRKGSGFLTGKENFCCLTDVIQIVEMLSLRDLRCFCVTMWSQPVSSGIRGDTWEKRFVGTPQNYRRWSKVEVSVTWVA